MGGFMTHLERLAGESVERYFRAKDVSEREEYVEGVLRTYGDVVREGFSRLDEWQEAYKTLYDRQYAQVAAIQAQWSSVSPDEELGVDLTVAAWEDNWHALVAARR